MVLRRRGELCRGKSVAARALSKVWLPEVAGALSSRAIGCPDVDSQGANKAAATSTVSALSTRIYSSSYLLLRCHSSHETMCNHVEHYSSTGMQMSEFAGAENPTTRSRLGLRCCRAPVTPRGRARTPWVDSHLARQVGGFISAHLENVG
jgi:hypothetical protein